MPRHAVLVAALLAVTATPAWPCSVITPLPTAETLIRRAEVILRARVQGLASTPGKPDGSGDGSSTQVRFVVLDVLKGRLTSSTIEFNGELTESDDGNNHAVPYGFVRPGGRSGNCYATTYRVGAEYLLMLRRQDHPSVAQPGVLTPYWAALSPTNEQLFDGVEDPWFVWSSRRARNR